MLKSKRARNSGRSMQAPSKTAVNRKNIQNDSLIDGEPVLTEN
ncbi:MAG: hypothetical protein ACOYVF_00870 [Candidatus Zixiibacteriota bacterium]